MVFGRIIKVVTVANPIAHAVAHVATGGNVAQAATSIVAAPVAIATTTVAVAAAPVELAADVATGRNVVDSLGSAAAKPLGFVAAAPPVVSAGVQLVSEVASGNAEGSLGRAFETATAPKTLQSNPVSTLLRPINKIIHGQKNKVVIIDASPDQGALGAGWDVGSKIGLVTSASSYKIIRGQNWAQVVGELAEMREVDEIQFWGHGCPGTACIGRDGLALGSLDGQHWKNLAAANIFRPGALVWFRSCSTFAGIEGKAFAKGFAKMFNVRVAGHTQLISAVHGGMVKLNPGENATWTDGVGPSCNATDLGCEFLGN
jgi:hypothetical protein